MNIKHKAFITVTDELFQSDINTEAINTDIN